MKKMNLTPEETAEAVDILNGLETLQVRCHFDSRAAGWWDTPVTEETVPTKLCLIHSEISEAMEGARKDLDDDHLPTRTMLEVELADAVIRIMDLAGAIGLDIGGAVLEKLAYNRQRADHKRENRVVKGGKKF